MNDAKCQFLFFSTLPELRKLCAMKITLSSHLAENEIRTAQRKMCRQLLLLHQDVLSSPVPGTLNQILVVMTILCYKSGKCQAYVEKHGATIGTPERVIPAVFQTCFSYTLIAKLAPSWNLAGHLLIQGKDFLSQRGKQNAVVMDINVTETQICISVEVCTVRLPPPKLEDFDISANILMRFDSDKNEIIKRHSVLSNWCYVLPSMKMGQIISISHVIPSESPFQSYSSLQLHWENLYGYILPKEPLTYCNIYFKMIGEQLFTYPLNCIRSQPVQYFPRIHLEGALNAFLTDLKAVLPHACGFPLKMTSKALYATQDLTRPSIQKVNIKPANLTGKRNCKVTLIQEIPKKEGALNAFLTDLKAVLPHACGFPLKMTSKALYATQDLTRPSIQKVNIKPANLTGKRNCKVTLIQEIPKKAGDGNIGIMGRKSHSRKQWKTSNEPAQQLHSTESFKMLKHLFADSLKKDSTRIVPIFKGKLLQMEMQTTKALPGKHKQTIPQYYPNVMKTNTAAKLTVFKPSSYQINKSLHDTTYKKITNGSVLQTQICQANIKCALNEKNENNGQLSTNGAGLDRNSSEIKSRKINSLPSTSDRLMHHASVTQQHLHRPANLSSNNKGDRKTTSQNIPNIGSKKTLPWLSVSDVEVTNPKTFQKQSPTEAAKTSTYRLSSSVYNKAKRGRDKKATVGPSNQDTIKTSSHQFDNLQVLKKNASFHCEDVNLRQIYSKAEIHLISAPDRTGRKHQIKKEEGSYLMPKKPRTSKTAI